MTLAVTPSVRRIAAALAVFALALVWAPSPVAAADEGVEAEFVALTNDARASRGIGRLAVHSELTAVARRWSAKMAADNRLSHNPNLAREVTADWEKLGENVGTGDNAPQIHSAFMNSPAHRANILDGDFTHVGIGVERSGDGRIWVTEVFMRPRGGGSTASSTPAPTTTRPPATTTPTTARPRPPATTAPPATAPPATVETTTTTTTTTTTVPLPPPPGGAARTPRYVLVLEGLSRLDRGR